ncbi:hypothetical protein HNR23_000481 [Nocardiopsis mwathae]|uniref:Lipoprotein n=1 Tax=Nocardiopsis mwathae TaxID=1472723 RepID=A0A7X0D465_9ACTN|nr:hypothetical protein [Nocardiopsis mwathae]MBB6170421.1 hypothetical protein [Nocardiopsis mwathae]
MSLLRPIAAAATAAALLTACDTGPAVPPSTEEPGSGEEDARIEAVPPPEDIPRAWWEGGSGGERVPGERVYSSWFVDGELREAAADGVADDVEAPAADRVEIELATPVAPIRVDLFLYDTLGADGTPTGVVAEYTCAPATADPDDGRPPAAGPGPDGSKEGDRERGKGTGSDCSYRSGDSVAVSADLPPETRVVIVNAGWYVPSEEREAGGDPSPEVSASWAFVVEEG